MKKLLYSGLTALMMLFAIGFAKADNAKVKVELNPTTWTLGETAPQFTVTITAATPAEETAVEGEEETTPAAPTLGTAEGNVAVKVTLTLDGTTKEQVITSSPVALTTTNLTAGTWTLGYALVKGDDQTTGFDGAAEMDNASTNSLTINAAAVAEKTATPTFKVGEEAKTSYELTADADASVTVTIVAAEGATVYYTTDGNEPTTTTPTTGTSVVINTACTLKAIAQETGKNASEVASFVVTKAEAPAPVEEKAVAPTFDPAAGKVEANAMVTIATTTGGAKVYYRKGEKAGNYAEYTAPIAITEACTLWAFASKDGMTNSDTVDAAYTIVALPADNEKAPALTFAPANTDSVDNLTEIEISGIPEGFTLYYALFENVADAVEAIEEYEETPIHYLSYYMETYGVKYPAVTRDEPVLVLVLGNDAAKYSYCRKYNVRAASDVDMPQIMSENAMAMELGLYPKGDKIKIYSPDEGYTLYYTTDGSKPVIDGANTTKSEEDVVEYILNASVTIKAIAVKDGKASDVKVARFTLIRDAKATIALTRGMSKVDSIVGKNSPLTVSIDCPESPEYIPAFPFTVYYTTDGTEPSAEAYTENGSIKKAEPVMVEDEDGYSSMVLPASVLVEKAGTLKAKAYIPVVVEGDEPGKYELNDTVVTQLFVYEIDSVISALNPEFNLASGIVHVGDTIRIKNPHPALAEDEDRMMSPMIYFSVNGPLPSSDKNQISPTVVYSSSNSEYEDEVVIIVKEDEKGTYAYIPVGEKYYDGSEKVYFECELKIQAICYDYVAGEGGDFPMPLSNRFGSGSLEYGSDFVEANYAVVDFAVKTVGGTMAHDTVVFADGKVAFDMFTKAPKDDTTYRLEVSVWNMADEDFPASEFFEITDSIRFEDTYYNGVYEVTFALQHQSAMTHGEYIPEIDTTILFAVTEGEVRPEITVKPVGNTMAHDTVVFADGNVAFDMLVEGLTQKDSTFKIYVTVWNMADEDDFPLAQEFDADDSVRFVNTYYNGVYEATFELMRRNPRGEYMSVVGQTVLFAVTENEEPVENYEFTVAPVGATKEGEKYTFTAADIAFDMFVKGMTESDNNLLLYATIYTEAQYDTFGYAEPKMMAAADSVRFATTLENGEYVGVFQLMRKGERDTVSTNAEDVTIKFTVKKKTANEAKELASVSIYPNPTDGEFNVVAPANANVEIFNAAGVLVKRMTVAEGNVQVRLSNSGIYFVRVRANGQMAVKKVVVR